MFLPFIGGQLVDRLDRKKVLLLFSTFVCLGQTLFALGVTIKSFPVMLVGRILFGIGGESISVVQASITTTWFK
jgi:MFS family permease